MMRTRIINIRSSLTFMRLFQGHRVMPLPVLLAFVAALCATIPSVASSHLHRSTNNDTLAIIGSRVIVAAEFAKSYSEKLRTTGLTDNGQSRSGYLSDLVDDEVLIARSRAEKLDRTPEALAEVKRIQLQELLNAYSAAHISPAIDVTDEDMRELFVRMNTKVNVRHLYAASRRDADSLYKELVRGTSFEELARATFTDPQLRDYGGSLGYIGFDEMDPAFENAAFAMKVGEISRPVKTVQGYSIIRVDDIKGNPFVTENEFLKAKDRLRRFVRKRKYEEAVSQRTALERSRLHIRFNEHLMNRMFSLIQRDGHDAMDEGALSATDLHRTAVTTNAGIWTAGRVIAALKTSTEAQRRWIRSEENFSDFVAGLIIREHIATMATQEGLNTRPSYREHVTYAFESYLATTMENRLKVQISFSQDSLVSYYQHHADKFRGNAQIRISVILLDTPAIADSVKQYLSSGVSFANLAWRYSIQRRTAERGGDVGFYSEDQLENLQKGMSRITAGQWEGPVTQDGKHLFVLCTERKAPVQRSFEESVPHITDILMGTSWPATRARWIEQFKKTLDCRTYPDRLMRVSLKPS